MPNFSIQTSKETLDSLEAALGIQKPDGLLEHRVSVTISVGMDHELTYYGLTAVMSLLAMGEIDKMKSAAIHLKHVKAMDQFKGNTKTSWAANRSYGAILRRYLANFDSMDSSSLGGMVQDFKYVQKVTDNEPNQEILDQILSNILNVDSPETFFPFLFNTYAPYVNSTQNASMSHIHVHKFYSTMINENFKRSLTDVTKWYQCTKILPQINGNNVLPEAYVTQKIKELISLPSGGQ